MLRISAFIASSSSAENTKPTTGLNSRARNTFIAWPQSTPDVTESAGAISWLAMPTPMIEPISVCEELAGRPRYQVPMFQTMAANNSAKIMS